MFSDRGATDTERLKELVMQAMNMGFSMGVVTARVKLMESLEPYLSTDILTSDLLTSRDVMKIALDALQEIDLEKEFEKMRAVVESGNQ
jgi:hypothetical protein